MKRWRAGPVPLYIELALAIIGVLISVLEKQRAER